MGLRALKIDALSLAEELENAGIPRPQADAQIKTTIKVVDMAIEERLVTKQDLTHGLHLTEEKLLTEISKTENKLMSEISKTEEKLLAEISKTNTDLRRTEDKLMTEISKLHEADKYLAEKIDKVEEKLSSRIDKMDEKFSAEISAGRKETQELKDKMTEIGNKVDRLFYSITFKLGATAFVCISAVGAILKIHF